MLPVFKCKQVFGFILNLAIRNLQTFNNVIQKKKESLWGRGSETLTSVSR